MIRRRTFLQSLSTVVMLHPALDWFRHGAIPDTESIAEQSRTRVMLQEVWTVEVRPDGVHAVRDQSAGGINDLNRHLCDVKIPEEYWQHLHHFSKDKGGVPDECPVCRDRVADGTFLQAIDGGWACESCRDALAVNPAPIHRPAGHLMDISVLPVPWNLRWRTAGRP